MTIVLMDEFESDLEKERNDSHSTFYQNAMHIQVYVPQNTHTQSFHLLMFGVCLAHQVRLFKFQLAVLVLLK